jgi:hypothetical protein
MEINLRSMIKIKNKIPLFLMLKLKIEIIIIMKNDLKLMENNKKMSVKKKMKLMCRMILNLQRRRLKERSVHLQVKERDPWVQRPIPYPQEVTKSQDNARFEMFIKLLKNLC